MPRRHAGRWCRSSAPPRRRRRAPGWCSTASSAYLPAPTERTRVALDPKGNEVAVACDPDGKLCAFVFKTTVDTFGKVSFFKVLRGTMRGDSHPITPRLGQDERFAQLGQPNGKSIVTVTEVVAGDIGVVTKLTHTQTGDTLCAKDAPLLMPPLPWPAATASAAIFARSKGDEDKIMSGSRVSAEEDATFSTDRDPVTNEVLVHGLGDVHLDVALGADEAEVRRRCRAASSEDSVPRDDHRHRASRPQVQEAVGRHRAVRRRDHRDRAASAGRRLRMGGQDLRRIDPAPVPSIGGEGRPPDDGAGSGHRAIPSSTSRCALSTGRPTASTARTSRFRSRARWRCAKPCRRRRR